MTDQSPLITNDATALSTVLIVDDLEANRYLLQRRLAKFGYHVVSADSGQMALSLLEKMTPDVILLDYMMPHMNGLEVLDRLRTMAATRDLPVIMVTARAEAEAVVEALDRGADDYVIKPIDFDVLRARMETHIEKRRAVSNMAIANAVLDQRVALRSMALADMDTELQCEIKKRQELENKLAQRQESAPVVADNHSTTIQKLAVIEDHLAELFANTANGQLCNPAKILGVKSLVTKLKCDLEMSFSQER